MTDNKKPVFQHREKLEKGYYRMFWKIPYLQDHHAMLILDKQWKYDLQSGMSPELQCYGDYSFSWVSNDKELEANMKHMTNAIAQSIPLYDEKMKELKDQQDRISKQDADEKKKEEEFKKKLDKMLE